MKTLEKFAKEGRINEDASIRDRQSVIINARIEKVWDILIDVANWPQWYSEVKKAKCGTVDAGESFEWTVKATNLKSIFQIVDTPTQLAWTGKSKFVKAIHVWTLEASDDQTIVTVEESIEGFLIPVFNRNSKIHDSLLSWLSALKIESEK